MARRDDDDTIVDEVPTSDTKRRTRRRAAAAAKAAPVILDDDDDDDDRDDRDDRDAVDDAPRPRKKSKRKSKPVGGGLYSRFLKRLGKVLLRPGAFWEGIRDADISVKEIMWPHVVILVGVRAVAGFAGTLFDGGTVGAAAIHLATAFVSWVALVWLFAFIVGAVATARGARINPQDPLRFAAYGLAPLFVVGIFAAVPVPYVTPIAELIAMPYTFQVMGMAMIPLLGVPAKRAPAALGLLCGVLLILWAVMPTLVPVLIAALTK